jgi:hypothetical protein
MFSKLKTLLRKAADRTFDALPKSARYPIASHLKKAPALSDIPDLVSPDQQLVLGRHQRHPFSGNAAAVRFAPWGRRRHYHSVMALPSASRVLSHAAEQMIG